MRRAETSAWELVLRRREPTTTAASDAGDARSLRAAELGEPLAEVRLLVLG